MSDEEQGAADLLRERTQDSETEKLVAKETKSLRHEVSRLQRQAKHRGDKFRDIRDSWTAAVEHSVKQGAFYDLVMPRPPAADRRKKEERIASLHIGDWHAGKETESYNLAVLDRRIELMTDKVIRFTQDQRASYRINECAVLSCGDLLEGEDVFPTQAHLIEEPLIDQCTSAAKIFVGMIVRLLGCFQRVRIVMVPGNHGRKSKWSHPKSNWDSIFAIMVKDILLGPDYFPRKEFRGRVTFEEVPVWYKVTTFWDWHVMVVHGHQLTGGSYGGQPWYAAARAAMGWSMSLPLPFSYLLIGHRHTVADATQDLIEWKATGSPESDNEYALERMKSMSVPAQRLYYLNEKTGICQEHTLFLVEPGERRPIQYRFQEKGAA